jgi:thiol-disulfide isomerase/thioredoxin
MFRSLRLLALLVAFGLVTGFARAEEKKDKKDDKKEDPYAALIGKPAPEISGAYALNGKPVKLSDLKGKVVLVDFWAVWCGPCIATFPHLRDWNKEFKDKGLEILGVTSYYENFTFDKKEGELSRAKEKLTKDQEHEMLKDFAAHHKLEHRLMTITKEDQKTVYDEYKIRGIPTVVLVDRKGIVRMVKVGSGEENAKELEKMIKTLLDEK